MHDTDPITMHRPITPMIVDPEDSVGGSAGPSDPGGSTSGTAAVIWCDHLVNTCLCLNLYRAQTFADWKRKVPRPQRSTRDGVQSIFNIMSIIADVLHVVAVEKRTAVLVSMLHFARIAA
jgi:hypothetical protein